MKTVDDYADDILKNLSPDLKTRRLETIQIIKKIIHNAKIEGARMEREACLKIAAEAITIADIKMAINERSDQPLRED